MLVDYFTENIRYGRQFRPYKAPTRDFFLERF